MIKRTLQQLLIAILIFGVLLGVGCKPSSSVGPAASKMHQVQPEILHKTLYFSGILQPLGEYTLTAPMNAVVEAVHYHFGQWVKKGELVLTLNSADLQRQYNNILTDYLKAKDNLTIARTKFTGTEDLWNAGLLSKNNYLSERSSLHTARVSLMQATHQLTELLNKMGNRSEQMLSTLSLDEFDKVHLALTGKNNQIAVRAPHDGVLLFPPKSSSESSSNRLMVGLSVKTDQVMALIGDLTGVRVEIDVPEVDVDKISPGIEALIRPVAFPHNVLRGKVISINAQASSAGTGGLPSFGAVVEVSQLSAEQQNWVKVGMSASIELETARAERLMVPIAAVRQVHGQSVVLVRTPEGDTQTRVVTTGESSAERVAIESGLSAGEWVMYD